MLLRIFTICCGSLSGLMRQITFPESWSNMGEINVILDTDITATLFYTMGFKGKADGDTTRTMVGACLKDSIKRNCLLFNWENEASSETLGIFQGETAYVTKAIPNSKIVGKELGDVLINLSNKYNLDLARVIMMGISLGAHLLGNIGRETKSSGKEIGSIIGLDPAGPIYDSILGPKQLDAESAKFVCRVHTSPGTYGTNKSMPGTVDVYANYKHFINGDNLQPGCKNGTFVKYSTDDLCSHNRAALLYEYAMLINKTSLIASKATDYYAWVNANGSASETIYLGDLINTNASRGNYYLNTNAPPNYGKGIEGLQGP